MIHSQVEDLTIHSAEQQTHSQVVDSEEIHLAEIHLLEAETHSVQ